MGSSVLLRFNLGASEMLGDPDMLGAPEFTFAQALDEGEIFILLISTVGRKQRR
jgi:hypothetical protein